MATPLPSELILHVHQEIVIHAPIAVVFAALLDELNAGGVTQDGKPIGLKLEPWPGGRWFRDLGNNSGHLWGHVQVIKPPKLLEITGPLFMSYPVASNVQYRLSEENGGTLIKFHHKAFGLIQDDHRQNVNKGWESINQRVRAAAEAKKKS